jgi:serine/threonine protein kinase
MDIPGYKVLREIGKGGMATVYLAIQESLDRPVVLKIMDSVDVKNSEDMIDRFLAEGRIIASLNHPNIITIYDIGIASNNSLYISMEYVEGGDLKQQIELGISPEDTLDYLRQIAYALKEAHKHGIIHRDVKPANILFKDETPILTDFGIAKQVDKDKDLTSTGIFLGSPNYVSPEQADGLFLDGRADIYSLGCIFYEMMTGKKPFRSDSVIGIVIQHQTAPIPIFEDDLVEYQGLLNKMLAKRREDRLPDVDALIQEIEKLQQGGTRHSTVRDFNRSSENLIITSALRVKREKQILIGLILFSMIMFSTLEYVDIRLKGNNDTGPIDVSTMASVNITPIQSTSLNTIPGQQINVSGAEASGANKPGNEEVGKALLFLGNQSLEKYNLTFPPNDNAYYYFTKLLELNPADQQAINGILEIADRYSVLAEQAMRDNEYEKSSAYVDLGLQINPENEALLSLKAFVSKRESPSLWKTFVGIFK